MTPIYLTQTEKPLVLRLYLPVGRHAGELPGVALVWAADAGGNRDILSLYL